MARIFLCYANEDSLHIEALYERLQDLGFEPWMDKKDLLPGQRWEQKIRHALKCSPFVLLCLSQNIGRAGFIQREFKLVVEALQEIPEDIIHTIPVRLERCDIPEQFGFLQCCDLFEEDGFDKLVKAVGHAFDQSGD